jgi:hypothetical protein
VLATHRPEDDAATGDGDGDGNGGGAGAARDDIEASDGAERDAACTAAAGETTAGTGRG